MNPRALVKTLDSGQVEPNLTNPWMKLFGLFKDDPYFDDVVNIMQAERDTLGDEEIDPAYYS
jgi:hypothetical protein